MTRDGIGSGAGASGFAVPTGAAGVALQQLARVVTELGAAQSMAAVVDAAVTHLAEAVRAAVTTLLVRDGDWLRMVGGDGLQPGLSDRWRYFPVAADNPAGEAVRLGRPVCLDQRSAIEDRYPALKGQVPPGRSIVCLPLGSGSASVGVAALTFDNDWLPGPRELDSLITFAAACGQAIRRIRAADAAATRARQLRFLADASVELAGSLDYRSTLTRVARLVVPDLADWCAVDVIEHGLLTTLAVAHQDPDKVAWAWQLQDRYPPDPDADRGAPKVARTARSEIYPEITDEMLVSGARDEQHLRLLRELDMHGALIVPLTAGPGTVLGAITLIRTGAAPRYDEADLTVAEELGRRAGLAVDNARQHSQTRDLASQLQSAVLADNLDSIAGWQIATFIEPSRSAPIGGDFYDAVALTEDRLAVFLGDVMGHGVTAAATMAQVCAAIRAFITVDPTPAHVIANLEQMSARLPLTELVTLVYAVIDPHKEQVELVNAGQCPPLIAHADGRAEFTLTAPRRALGAAPDRHDAAVFPIHAADTLLLFTDGLVERRGELIDAGLRRLRDNAAVLGNADLGAALRHVATRMRNPDSDDDIAAVAVRSALSTNRTEPDGHGGPVPK